MIAELTRLDLARTPAQARRAVAKGLAESVLDLVNQRFPAEKGYVVKTTETHPFEGDRSVLSHCVSVHRGLVWGFEISVRPTSQDAASYVVRFGRFHKLTQVLVIIAGVCGIGFGLVLMTQDSAHEIFPRGRAGKYVGLAIAAVVAIAVFALLWLATRVFVIASVDEAAVASEESSLREAVLEKVREVGE